jgi:AraC family transcriptional regulator
MSNEVPSRHPLQEVIPLLLNVEHQLDGELGLKALARQYGYSPYHFHRFFSHAVGETPKQHVHRLRLERAAYKLAITNDSVLDIALAVGFKNHETFSRAFRRAFDYSPKDYRLACQACQAARLERNRGFRGDGCLLSDVRFVTLPAMHLVAIRRHGAYAECPIPFSEDDDCWTKLADWAKQHQFAHHLLPIAISYDDPTVTPLPLQRLDACIPLQGDVSIAETGWIRMFRFAGGLYGGIEHTGPLSTISQAYSGVADGIRRSPYVFGEEPPVQIYRKVRIGGDPSANLTEVYFPVRKAN